MYSLSKKVCLSNIQHPVEGCLFFFFLVWGALIIAIIQSFKDKKPVGEAAGHALILLEELSTARTVRKHTGVLTKCCDRKSLFDIEINPKIL